MARRLEVSTRINKTMEDSWLFISDFSNAPQWMPGVSQLEKQVEENLDDTLEEGIEESIGRGSILRFIAHGKVHKAEVTYWQQGISFRLLSQRAGITTEYTYSLATEPLDQTACVLTLKVESIASGLWKLIHPLIFLATEKNHKQQVTNIKYLLENLSHFDKT